MKNLYIILFILGTTLFQGCSTNDIDYALARAAGNKPAGFFYFKNSYDANHHMFHHKDFDLLMIETKQQDWIDMGGWHGAYIYGGIGLGLEIKEVGKYGDIFGYASISIPQLLHMKRESAPLNIRIYNIFTLK